MAQSNNQPRNPVPAAQILYRGNSRPPSGPAPVIEPNSKKVGALKGKVPSQRVGQKPAKRLARA